MNDLQLGPLLSPVRYSTLQDPSSGPNGLEQGHAHVPSWVARGRTSPQPPFGQRPPGTAGGATPQPHHDSAAPDRSASPRGYVIVQSARKGSSPVARGK